MLREPPRITVEGLEPEELHPEGQPDQKVIPIREIRFEPRSAVFDPRSLERLALPYIGQTVSLRDLYGLVGQINQLYDKKGYLSRATIPSQTLADGVLIIRLVEARYGDVRVYQESLRPGRAPKLIYSTNRRQPVSTPVLAPFWYRGEVVHGRAFLEPGRMIRPESLEKTLEHYNLLNGSRLRAKLVPGRDVGYSDLELILTPERPVDFSLYVDNYGRKSTGENRLGGMLTVRNLTGLGDTWFLNGVTSEDSGISNGFVSGNVPITPKGLAVTGTYEDNNYAIINGPWTTLDISGWSRRSTVGLSRPFYVSSRGIVRGYLQGSFYESENAYSGFAQDHVRDDSIILGATWDRFAPTVYQFLDLSCVYSFYTVNQETQRAYSLFRGSYVRVKKYTPRDSVIFRATGQYAADQDIAAIDQFLVGGMATVRGYSESMLSGDSGYTLGLEWNHAWKIWNARRKWGLWNYPVRSRESRFSTFLFFDHGWADTIYMPSNDPNNFLFGAGGGAELQIAENIRARLTLSAPLRENDYDVDYKDVRLNFFVQYSF